MEVVDQYWETEKSNSFLKFIPPIKEELYKQVSEIINRFEQVSILDYGCGIGSQIAYLNTKNKIYLYDTNIHCAQFAYLKFRDLKYDIEIVQEPLYNKKKVDFIISNMVWMCLKNELEIDNFLKNICNFCNSDTKLFLSITNPYSRKDKFSYFYTEYSESNTFDYFENGKTFKVFINDTHKTIFNDYHWTFDYTLKKLKSFNFFLEDLIELRDIEFEGFVNKKIPPYQLLILNYNKK